MNKLSYEGWIWAHEMVRPIYDANVSHADAAYAAILIAYRSGLREGLDRAGRTPNEILYSDFDLTDQMERFDEGMTKAYGWPTREERKFPA